MVSGRDFSKRAQRSVSNHPSGWIQSNQTLSRTLIPNQRTRIHSAVNSFVVDHGLEPYEDLHIAENLRAWHLTSVLRGHPPPRYCAPESRPVADIWNELPKVRNLFSNLNAGSSSSSPKLLIFLLEEGKPRKKCQHLIDITIGTKYNIHRSNRARINVLADQIVRLLERFPGDPSTISTGMWRYIVNAAIVLTTQELLNLPPSEFSQLDIQRSKALPPGDGLNLNIDQMVLLFSLSTNQRWKRAKSVFQSRGEPQPDYVQKLYNAREDRRARKAAAATTRWSPAPEPILPMLHLPVFDGRQYSVWILGVDPTTSEDYGCVFRITPTLTKVSPKTTVPQNHHFREWYRGEFKRRWGHNLKQVEPTINQQRDPQHQQAVNLCKLAAIKYNGSYCSESELEYLLKIFYRPWRSIPQRTGVYKGFQPWILGSQHLHPSDLLIHDYDYLPPIWINSNQTTRFVATATSILDTYIDGLGIELGWLYGCREADLENLRIQNEERPPRLFCICTGPETQTNFHICEGCLGPTICSFLIYDDVVDLKLCVTCRLYLENEDAAVLASDQLKKTPDVGRRLMHLLRRDARICKWTDKKLNQQYHSIMKGLIRERGVSTTDNMITGWHDKYFERICPDTDRTSVGQHGRFHSPKIASVEAVHSIALDEDENLVYHYLGNVTVTGDSDNRRKWAMPVIIFLANKASRDATTLEELEGVAALFDIIYVNTQEVAVNRKARLGGRMSRKRVHDIQQASQYGTLLETRNVPESHLWKTHCKQISMGPDDWRPPTYDYFWSHFLLIAVLEGFGDRADLWQRDGFFFAFSPRTSRKVVWGHRQYWVYFTHRWKTLTTVCDKGCDSGWTVETIMMIHLRKFLKMLKPLKDENGKSVLDEQGRPAYVARDELVFELQPIHRHPEAAVLAHVVHKFAMSHGYRSDHPNLEDQRNWKEEDCNVRLQTKLTNYALWDYAADTYPYVIESLDYLRKDSDIFPPSLDHLDLIHLKRPCPSNVAGGSTNNFELADEQDQEALDGEHASYIARGVHFSDSIRAAQARDAHDARQDDGYDDDDDDDDDDDFQEIGADERDVSLQADVTVQAANGFRNPTGTTCYINSALQVFNRLAAAECLLNKAEYDDKVLPNLGNGGNVAIALQEILKELRGPVVSSGISTQIFCGDVLSAANSERIKFLPNAQGDAGEFLAFLLESSGIDAVLDGTFGVNNASASFLAPAVKQISLNIATDWECSECGHPNRKISGMKELLLGFNNDDEPTTLADLLKRNYSQPETVTKQCPVNLRHLEATSRDRLSQIPTCVIVRFKRSVPDPNDTCSLRLIKKTNHVPTEEYLNFWDILHPDVQDMYLQGAGRKSAQLRLSSLIRHFGEENAGHYKAYTKTVDGQWLCHNDAKVTLCEDPCLQKAHGNDFIAVYQRASNASDDIFTSGTSEALEILSEPQATIAEDKILRDAIFKFMTSCEAQKIPATTESVETIFRVNHPAVKEQVRLSIFRDLCLQDEATQNWQLRTKWSPGGSEYERFFNGETQNEREFTEELEDSPAVPNVPGVGGGQPLGVGGNLIAPALPAQTSIAFVEHSADLANLLGDIIQVLKDCCPAPLLQKLVDGQRNGFDALASELRAERVARVEFEKQLCRARDEDAVRWRKQFELLERIAKNEGEDKSDNASPQPPFAPPPRDVVSTDSETVQHLPALAGPTSKYPDGAHLGDVTNVFKKLRPNSKRSGSDSPAATAASKRVKRTKSMSRNVYGGSHFTETGVRSAVEKKPSKLHALKSKKNEPHRFGGQLTTAPNNDGMEIEDPDALPRTPVPTYGKILTSKPTRKPRDLHVGCQLPSEIRTPPDLPSPPDAYPRTPTRIKVSSFGSSRSLSRDCGTPTSKKSKSTLYNPLPIEFPRAHRRNSSGLTTVVSSTLISRGDSKDDPFGTQHEAGEETSTGENSDTSGQMDC